jgi:hypothetical protein
MPQHSLRKWWQTKAGERTQNTKMHAYREGDRLVCHKNRLADEKTRRSCRWKRGCYKHRLGHGLTHDVWGMWRCWPLREQLPRDPWGSLIHQ